VLNSRFKRSMLSIVVISLIAQSIAIIRHGHVVLNSAFIAASSGGQVHLRAPCEEATIAALELDIKSVICRNERRGPDPFGSDSGGGQDCPICNGSASAFAIASALPDAVPIEFAPMVRRWPPVDTRVATCLSIRSHSRGPPSFV
jgi:hypothetical protein